jgi:hypothetical protein
MSEVFLMNLQAPEILQPEGEYQKGVAALKKEASPILSNAQSIPSVSTAEEHASAVAAGRLLQAMNKKTSEFYKPYKKRIDEMKRVVLDEEKSALDALDVEKKRLGLLIFEWEQQEQKRQQEQLQREREAAQKTAEEERLADAIALEAEGDTEGAAAMLETPAMPVPVIVQRTAPKQTRGKVQRTTYRGKVVNFRALVCACAAGKIPLDALEVNQSFVNLQANAFREGLNWPGVDVEIEVSTHFRN